MEEQMLICYLIRVSESAGQVHLKRVSGPIKMTRLSVGPAFSITCLYKLIKGMHTKRF